MSRLFRLAFDRLAAFALATAAAFAPAYADTPAEEFYKKTPVTMLIAYPAGGGFDLHARVVARHMGQYLPGKPNIIVRNMPGAGSIVGSNHLYHLAPRDGSVFGLIRGPIFEPMVGNGSSNFDITKFNWIGSGMVEFTTCALLNNPAINSFDDMTKVAHTLASAGPGSDDDIISRLVIKIYGTKGRIVTGYPGGSEMTLAIERGEVDGRCGWSWTSLKQLRPQWITEKKIKVFASISAERWPELPDVPSILELAKTDRQRQIMKLIITLSTLGRPFAAPPETPADRVALLRQAFAATMKTPEYIAEVTTRREQVVLTDGATAQTLINEMVATPKELLAEARAIISE